MKITLDYLKGIVDALYYAQTPLLGGEIEDEKNFQINAYKGFFGFDVRLTSTENYKRAKFENDLHEDIMYIQVIDLGKDITGEGPYNVFNDVFKGYAKHLKGNLK